MVGSSPFGPGLLIRPVKPDLYRSNPSYLKGLRYSPPATRWVGDGAPLPSSMIPECKSEAKECSSSAKHPKHCVLIAHPVQNEKKTKTTRQTKTPNDMQFVKIVVLVCTTFVLVQLLLLIISLTRLPKHHSRPCRLFSITRNIEFI
ncbi:hypothetical protein ElyMa_000798800 [Elysia marginata]|uniref:Uncharacterized protein n=1 Tax=Elysia marginata TaxID=1093978 RepID=A0AAV4GUS6_9GAST|nr:hypothetical protein ElyMa_000798800 [Elysia marginata]